MIRSSPAVGNEDEKDIIVTLLADTFGNQLILGDIHAPMNKLSDVFKIENETQVIGGWSIFKGFKDPVICFPTTIPDAWSAIINLIDVMQLEKFTLPYPQNSEVNHKRKPWEEKWNNYELTYSHSDIAMRITERDVKVHDISDLPEIRAATEDDLSKLEEFYSNAEKSGDFRGFFHPLQLKSDNYVVCVDDDEIIGTGGTHFETPYTMQLGNIYVNKSYRRKGIGRAMTTACVLGSIKTQRVPTLFVHEDNTNAISMYEDIGFDVYDKFDFYIAERT